MIDTLTPTAGRILVERIQEAATTAAGLIVPDEARETTQMARVLRVAPDVYEVTPGETVVLGSYAGQQHELDGRLCHFVPMDEVLGVVEDDDASLQA